MLAELGGAVAPIADLNGAVAPITGFNGAVAPMSDPTAMAGLLMRLVRGTGDLAARATRAASSQARFDFPRYTAALLAEALPDLPRISVVVPSYNYAQHLEARLASIFGQTYPVAEVLVLDDASLDDSVAVARRVADQWQRDIRLVENLENSGQVFAQWRRGVALAQGDWIWIAEADDEADPGLLAALVARLEGAVDVVLVACDSQAMDSAGAVLWPSYQPYFATSGAASLAQDGLFDAHDFAARFLGQRNLLLNVSAMLFRRTALLAALDRCGERLAAYRLAGDWRLYLELLAGGGATAGGQVAWVAAPLNRHRRHGASLTGGLEPAVHVAEIARVQADARALLGPLPGLAERQGAYLAEVAATLDVAPRLKPRSVSRSRNVPRKG